jgi:bifunctional DNase/RNase
MAIRCGVSGCVNDATDFGITKSNAGTWTELAFCKKHNANLPMDYATPDPRQVAVEGIASSFEDCYVYAVFFQYAPDRFTVVLKGKESGGVFVLQTGYIEATVIRGYLAKMPHPTPLTHELISNLTHALGGSLTQGLLHGYDKTLDAYKCSLVVVDSRRDLQHVVCRVTDAVSCSVCTEIPLKINAAFLGKDLSKP